MLASCVFFIENTLHALKPVFLDMSNYTDVDQKVTRQHFSPLTRETNGRLAFNGICILQRILQLFTKFFAFCNAPCIHQKNIIHCISANSV